MAQVNTTGPQVTRTTIQREVVDGSATPARPEFWEYIEALKPADWDRHVVYIYRHEPRIANYGDGAQCIEKLSNGIIEMPDSCVRAGFPKQVPFASREDVEMAIRAKHGGKVFRFILKRGNERLCETKIANDAPPILQPSPYASSNDSSTFGGGPSSEASATADVARTALATLAGQEKQSAAITMDVLATTANVIKSFAEKQMQPNGAGGEDLMHQMMTILMQRALAPPPDPIDMLTKLLTLQKALLSADPASPQNPTLAKIMDTALERMLNAPASAAATSAGAELVRQLPQVANYITESIREWRIGTEMQRDTAAMMTGAKPAQPSGIQTPQTQQNPALGSAIIPAAPGARAGTPVSDMTNGPSLEFVEQKIVEIIKDHSMSADEAADEAMAFLDRLAPQLVQQMTALGKGGILTLFNNRQHLKLATVNMPRLGEFVDSFLKYAAQGTTAPAPVN